MHCVEPSREVTQTPLNSSSLEDALVLALRASHGHVSKDTKDGDSISSMVRGSGVRTGSDAISSTQFGSGLDGRCSFMRSGALQEEFCVTTSVTRASNSRTYHTYRLVNPSPTFFTTEFSSLKPKFITSLPSSIRVCYNDSRVASGLPHSLLNLQASPRWAS